MLAMDHRGGQDRVWRRDRNAVLSGVCAGLSEDLDLPLPLVRLVTVIFLVLPTGLAYLALSMLLRRGPVARRTQAAASWRPAASGGTTPAQGSPSKDSASKDWALLRHRFETLEPRLKRIEAFVTSREFELDRGFRRMGE